MEPQNRKLGDLKKLANNPRTISADDFERLKQSIKNNPDYFMARPIILSDRTGELVIIGGNQRYEAAKSLGIESVPTFLLSGLTEQREREIIIRDNVNNGEFDWSMIANEWDTNELRDWGVELPAFDDEIDAPDISPDKPDQNTITIYATNEQAAIIRAAIDAADAEHGEFDGKRIPAAITAICKEFIDARG